MSNKSPVLKASYSHIGVCVSDLERSKAFYREALGFVEGAVFESGNEVKQLVGIDNDIEMISQMMVLDTFVVELICFKRPLTVSSGELRAINQTGLTHLSFVVEDVDAAAKHLASCGAKVLSSTHTNIEVADDDSTELIFCTDPDGTRIELYKPSSHWQP